MFRTTRIAAVLTTAAALALPSAALADISVDAHYEFTGPNQVRVTIVNQGDPFYWAEVSALDATHATAPEPAAALSTCLAGSPATWCSWPEDLKTGETGVMDIDVNRLPGAGAALRLKLDRRTGDDAFFVVTPMGSMRVGEPAAKPNTVPACALQGQCAMPPTAACPATAGQLLRGGPLDETLAGTAGGDDVNALEGNDVVRGLGANDILRGGPGRDAVDGGACDDVIFSAGDFDARWDGGTGNDVLNGAAALMNGGPGDDWIYNGYPRATTNAGTGNDHISVTNADQARVDAGRGNDVIDARNRSRDVIDCGRGRDTVYADARDRLRRNCEVVKYR